MEMSEVIVHHDLQRTVDILARALHHDPLGRYLQLDTYRLPNSTIIDLEQSRRWFNDLVLERHSESAVLAQLQDGGAVSVWTPPSITGCLHAQNEELLSSAAIADLDSLSQQAKSRHLRVTGKVIGPFVEQALTENHIVWLDASNPHARDVYLKLGFRIAEELIVGKGRCDESGNLAEGGTGISVWSMMMDPLNDWKKTCIYYLLSLASS